MTYQISHFSVRIGSKLPDTPCGSDLYGHYMGGDRHFDITCASTRQSCTIFDLRWKFVLLSLIQPFVTALVRPCARVYRLSKGDFIQEGSEKAIRIWRRRNIAAAVNRKSPPSRLDRKLLVLRCVIWQLGKELLKIATLPLAAALFEVIAIAGFFAPHYARVAYSFIERQWSQERMFVENITHTKMTNCLSLCMQPKRVWEEQNLFAVFDDYNKGTFKSLLNKYRNLLLDNRQSLELLKVDVEECLGNIQNVKEALLKEGRACGGKISDALESKSLSGETIQQSHWTAKQTENFEALSKWLATQRAQVTQWIQEIEKKLNEYDQSDSERGIQKTLSCKPC